MNKFNDHSPKSRLLKILLDLLQRPNGYTKKQLGEKYSVHEDTIKKDFEEIRSAGFTIEYDSHYRYALDNDTAYEYLQEMLYWTEDEQKLLYKALESVESKGVRVHHLQQKLASLHDLTLLGSHLINRSFLSKINVLEKAKKFNNVVRLIDYRSTNSNQVQDRLVEAFHISPKDDMIQTYDLEVKALRHYRLSRIQRVEIEKTTWAYQSKHYVEATDPFRIADNEQVSVHVRLKVGGYNELIERFPLTLSYLTPSGDTADEYELECKVNHRFYGLTNFLLGYHDHVIEVVSPDTLKKHLETQIKKLKYAK